MGTSIEQAEGSRGFQEAVSYAIGHRIRVEIIAALHDLGSASAVELSRVVHQPLSTVTHHVSELLKSGSIHIDRTEKVKSVNQHYYKLINPLFLSDEEMRELSEDERKEVCRILLQGLTAEALAAFWSGDLPNDPRLFISWNWFNVDAQGRAEIAEEQVRSWRRILEIEKEAGERCANSGDKPFSLMVAGLSYPRWRWAAKADNKHESW
jgi:DNA-binding transcriptional ArsR family regulator